MSKFELLEALNNAAYEAVEEQVERVINEYEFSRELEKQAKNFNYDSYIKEAVYNYDWNEEIGKRVWYYFDKDSGKQFKDQLVEIFYDHTKETAAAEKVVRQFLETEAFKSALRDEVSVAIRDVLPDILVDELFDDVVSAKIEETLAAKSTGRQYRWWWPF